MVMQRIQTLAELRTLLAEHRRAAGIALVCCGLVLGCSPKQGELVVAKVGNNEVTLKEYETLYVKKQRHARASGCLYTRRT